MDHDVQSLGKLSKPDSVQVSQDFEPATDRSSETRATDLDAERRCLRKFDLMVMPQISIILLIGFLDRSNIGNARVMGMEADTGLTGTQFNNVASLFFVSYAIFEILWALLIQAVGANYTMATAIVGWSAVTIGTGFARNYHQLIVCRLLLGLFEACTAPACTLIISTIYPRGMQGKRVASIYYGMCASGAFGGIIAYGVQVMGARHGLAAWRWLFIIEGSVSLLLGGICYVSLPKTPDTAWFLTTEERAAMVAIQQREMAYRGKQMFEWKYMHITISDCTVWISALTGHACALPLVCFSLFAPTLILGLGYTRIEANYLSVPLYVVATLALAMSTWLSDKLNRRGLVIIPTAFLGILGYAIVLASPDSRVGFFAMFLLGASLYPFLALANTWLANNFAPDNKRIVALPILFGFTLVAGVFSSQLYPASDGPRYIMGNAVSLAAIAAAGFGCLTLWFIWRRRNAGKAKLLAEGAIVNRHEDDRGLNFVYVL